MSSTSFEDWCDSLGVPSYPATGRPLNEPPIFDYEYFLEENRNQIPTDVRLRRLFAKDIGMGYKWRDEMTEERLMNQFVDWADDMKEEDSETSRQRWYGALYKELCADAKETRGKGRVILRQALDDGIVSEVGLWECTHLDEDGGTKRLQEEMDAGEDVFQVGSSTGGNSNFADIQLMEKYDHVIPPDYFEKLCKEDAYLEQRFWDLETCDAFLKRYEKIKWLHEALTEWRVGKTLGYYRHGYSPIPSFARKDIQPPTITSSNVSTAAKTQHINLFNCVGLSSPKYTGLNSFDSVHGHTTSASGSTAAGRGNINDCTSLAQGLIFLKHSVSSAAGAEETSTMEDLD